MKFIAMVALISLLASFPVEATTTVYRLQLVCTFDIQQYCKDIRRTLTKQIKECLARHERELLPYCQDHYKEAH
jgi:Cysteine rich repeat